MATTDATIISLKPAFVDFVDLVQGDTLSFKVTLTDDAAAPIDLTGTSADMEIKRLDGTLVLALTVGDGITFSDAEGGEMTVEVSASDTTDLEPDYTYRYDLQWTNGTTIRTLAWGTIRAIEQITD